MSTPPRPLLLRPEHWPSQRPHRIGGKKKQDYLLITDRMPDFEIGQSGKDAIIEFENGDGVMLRSVAVKDLDDMDFSPFG